MDNILTFPANRDKVSAVCGVCYKYTYNIFVYLSNARKGVALTTQAKKKFIIRSVKLLQIFMTHNTSTTNNNIKHKTHHMNEKTIKITKKGTHTEYKKFQIRNEIIQAQVN